MQILHKLRITEKHINTNFIPCLRLLRDAEVLQNKGKVTAAIAKAFAESESPQYRVIQDQLYQSDFDRLMEDVNRDGNSLHEK